MNDDASTGREPSITSGIVRSPLVEQIVELIAERILSGELAPGTPLRQEELAAELGVSRTPLREALRVLRSDGFLTGGSGKGTLTVVSVTAERVRDIYEVRAMIDGFAAGLASRRASDAEIERLDRLSTAIEKPAGRSTCADSSRCTPSSTSAFCGPPATRRCCRWSRSCSSAHGCCTPG